MIAAASRLGKPLLLLQAAKSAGCLAFKPGGPVDVGELERYLSEHPEVTTAQDGPISKEIEERLKLRAERRMKEHKLDLAKRVVIPSDEIRRTFTRYVVANKSKTWAAIKTASQEIGLALGLTSEQMLIVEEKMVGRVRVAYEELARCEWGVAKCAKCGEEIKP